MAAAAQFSSARSSERLPLAGGSDRPATRPRYPTTVPAC